MGDPVVEFLTKALSQTGSERLPYGENQRWTEFRSLHPSVQTFTENNGRAVKLLRAQGTLPMYHRGIKYNIPVSIWLPERYPAQAPLLFVEPTPEMGIAQNHAFVNASGCVRSSYIASWDPARSNLVDMTHDTAIQFGESPPLFAKPPGWAEAAVAAHPSHEHNLNYGNSSSAAVAQLEEEFQHNPMIGPSSGSYSNGSARGGYGSPRHDSGVTAAAHDPPGASLWAGVLSATQQESKSASPPGFREQLERAQAASLQSHQQHQQQKQQQQQNGAVLAAHAAATAAAEDLDGEFRRAAIACLSRRLHASLTSAEAQAAAETNALLETQMELSQRGTHLQMAIQDMARERHVLESAVLEMNTKGQEVAAWLAANEAKTPEGEIHPDTAIVAADALCAQALEAQAEDMAIEDTLYALERAFQSGALDAAAYLKQVRMLCGTQFYVRSLGMKIAALQHLHPPPPPPPPPLPSSGSHQPGQWHQAQQQRQQAMERVNSVGRPLQMQIGDSWTSTGVLTNPLQSG